MRGASVLFVLIILSATLAGCLQSDPNGGPNNPQGSFDSPQDTGPNVVIGVVDTGINPYHTAFRDNSTRAYTHPSSYLPDYPTDSIAINITFDHDNIQDALEADCAQWEQVEPGTLYWFPGTRIIAAYASPGNWEDLPYQDSTRGPITCSDTDRAAWGNLFGANAHGTLTTSRAAANGFGACEECLIASVQGLGPHPVRWVAEQPWIDLSSHSWGPQVPLFQPSGMPIPRLFADPELLEAVEDAAREQTAIWASGNGVLFRYGVVGHPTQAGFHMAPHAIRVGAHDNGHITVWHGSSPHVVADACGNWLADHDTMSSAGARPTGGTSLAAPWTAGIAGKILLEARRLLEHHATGVHDGVLAEGTAMSSGPLDDGVFTKDEFERLLLVTADTAPEAFDEDGSACDPLADPLGNPTHLLIPALPVQWKDVPEGPAGVPLIGYGATTAASAEHAINVLFGEAPLPGRDVEDAYFEADRAYREAMYGGLTTVP